MKSILLAVLMLSPVTAWAATPEEAYIAARDAAITQMSAMSDAGGTASAQYDKAADNLTQMLRSMLGPIAVKDFPGPGTLHIGSLYKGDEGFGELDGLEFTSTDGKGTLVVSPEPIFRHWLIEHKSWWEDPSLGELPLTPDASIRSDAFYTQGVQADAAFTEIAELPLKTPVPTTAAVALLAGRSQDETPVAPTELVVTVLIGNKLLIAEVPLKSPIPAVPACSKIIKAAEPKIAAANEAYIASGRKDLVLAKKLDKLQSDTDTAFHTCFATKSQTQKGYVAAIAQAQALAVALTAK